jgi:hypothetical protein
MADFWLDSTTWIGTAVIRALCAAADLSDYFAPVYTHRLEINWMFIQQEVDSSSVLDAYQTTK